MVTYEQLRVHKHHPNPSSAGECSHVAQSTDTTSSKVLFSFRSCGSPFILTESFIIPATNLFLSLKEQKRKNVSLCFFQICIYEKKELSVCF